MRVLGVALLTMLVLAGPAGAADQAVQAVDYDFLPRTLRIEPGDSVTWTFGSAVEHTSTSARGESEQWDSGLKSGGATFSHTFDRPGRYAYICLPHRFSMKGTIQVGEDTVPTTARDVRSARGKTSFRLLEPARVSGRLRGPTKRTLRARRLEPGRRSLSWGRLEPGSYTGTLTFVDDFDVRSTKRVTFVRR